MKGNENKKQAKIEIGYQEVENSGGIIASNGIIEHKKLCQAEWTAAFWQEIAFKLPQNQESFCQLYIKYGNATRAYKEAYPNDKSKDKTICENACKLKAKANIKARIEQLKRSAMYGAVMSRWELLTRLSDIARSGAKDRGRAWELLSKYYAMDKRSIDVTGTIRADIKSEGTIAVEVREIQGISEFTQHLR